MPSPTSTSPNDPGRPVDAAEDLPPPGGDMPPARTRHPHPLRTCPSRYQIQFWDRSNRLWLLGPPVRGGRCSCAGAGQRRSVSFPSRGWQPGNGEPQERAWRCGDDQRRHGLLSLGDAEMAHRARCVCRRRGDTVRPGRAGPAAAQCWSPPAALDHLAAAPRYAGQFMHQINTTIYRNPNLQGGPYQTSAKSWLVFKPAGSSVFIEHPG